MKNCWQREVFIKRCLRHSGRDNIGKNSHFLFTFLDKCDKIILNPARFLWIVLDFVL